MHTQYIFPSFQSLLLEGVEVYFGLEFDLDVSGGQSLVDVGNSVNLILKGSFFVLIKIDLLDNRAVELVSVSSSDDTSGEDEVFEKGVIDSSQTSASGSLLRSVFLNPLGVDGSLSGDEDVSLESLFEFGDQLSMDSVDNSVASEGNVDDDDVLLLSLADDFNFSGVGNEEILDGVLKVGDAILDFEESLGDGFFNNAGVAGNVLVELGLVVGHIGLTGRSGPSSLRSPK